MNTEFTNGSNSGEGSNQSVSEEAVPIQMVISFLTEFNVNAAIFNEVIGQFMGDTITAVNQSTGLALGANSKADTAYNNGLKAMGEINLLKARVTRLDGAIGADNPNFQTPDRTNASSSGSGGKLI